MLTRGRVVVGASIATLVVGLLGGAALGGHVASRVESYTGCLGANGDLGKLMAGDTPLKPCSGNQTQVHLSGGDITAILTGTGLIGGADNGAATIELAPSYALPQGCLRGQEARWDGTSWICWNDGEPGPVSPLP